MKKAYVGMPVHFYQFPIGTHKGPQAGFITHIWPDDIVNLAVFDAHGSVGSAQGVELVSDNDRKPVKESYAMWILDEDKELDEPVQDNAQPGPLVPDLNAKPITEHAAPSKTTAVVNEQKSLTAKFQATPPKQLP
jgi:hypothetical protein